MFKLALLFLATAILYAIVGFGGGSTYTALLVLVGTDYDVLPKITLLCNIIVVSGGVWRFHAKKFIPWQTVWPLFVLSVPAAWFGGRLPVSEDVFIFILGLTLALAGGAMLLQKERPDVSFATGKWGQSIAWPIPLIGAGLGFVSGLVGLGGGIFLAPVLHLMRWGHPKMIAGVCSAFILVNSVSGLIGQMMKFDNVSSALALAAYWPLFLAVLIGGQMGSRAGSHWLAPHIVKRMTAVLILIVAVRLLWSFY